jgi:hypothetical protein
MSTGNARAWTKLNANYGSARAAGVPATFYAEAYEVAPDNSGGGTPMTYPGYARVAVSNVDAMFPPAVLGDREKSNALEIEFPTPTIHTNQIVAVALHAHVTADDIFDWEYLPNPISGLAAERLLIPVGALVLTIP